MSGVYAIVASAGNLLAFSYIFVVLPFAVKLEAFQARNYCRRRFKSSIGDDLLDG